MDVYTAIAVAMFSISIVLFIATVTIGIVNDIKKCFKISKAAKKWYSERGKDGRSVKDNAHGRIDAEINNNSNGLQSTEKMWSERQAGSNDNYAANSINPNVVSSDVDSNCITAKGGDVGTVVETDDLEGNIGIGMAGELSGNQGEGTVCEDDVCEKPFKIITEISLLATNSTLVIDI